MTINHEGKKLNYRGEKTRCTNSPLQIFEMDYERNTNKSKDRTDYHRYNRANSKHGTLNCGGKKEYFEHNKINHDCITHHSSIAVKIINLRQQNLIVTNQIVDSK